MYYLPKGNKDQAAESTLLLLKLSKSQKASEAFMELI